MWAVSKLLHKKTRLLKQTTRTLASKVQQQNILVYGDSGANKEGLRQTLAALKESAHPKYVINTIMAETILKTDWEKDTKLLVFPAGYEVLYWRKLYGTGNTKMKDWVSAGGSFLGIGAGAYYSSQAVEFEKGTTKQVLGERELKFFVGKAIGSAFSGFAYDTQAAAWPALINWVPNNTQCKFFSFGGCYFEPTEIGETGKFEVLATYAEKDNLPAVIKCKVGSGTAILCGSQPEYSATRMVKEEFTSDIVPELLADEAKRLAIVKDILLSLGIDIAP